MMRSRTFTLRLNFVIFVDVVSETLKDTVTEEGGWEMLSSEYLQIWPNKIEIIETKDMNCPNRHETLGDQNHFECPCPKDCPRHGTCCACVAHHRKHGKLPFCLRDMEQEAKG